MVGSNSTALRQHAYSIFTASLRQRESTRDMPSSVLRAGAADGASDRQHFASERVAEPKNSGLTPPPGQTSGALGGNADALDVNPLGRSQKAGAPEAGQASRDASRASQRAPKDASPDAAEPPSQEDIRRRAYDIFLARDGRPGDPVRDWLEAEAQLRRERGLV